MNTALADDLLRFPIGRVQLPTAPLTPAERAPYFAQLAALPAQLAAAVQAAGPLVVPFPDARPFANVNAPEDLLTITRT